MTNYMNDFFTSKIRIFLLLIVLSQVGTGHEDDIHSIEYTEDNFASELKNKNTFVMFYAPWCEHCRRLSGTWEQLAKTLNKDDTNIQIAKVDCTKSGTLCSQHDVTGYPTLKFFKQGENKGTRFRGTRDLPTLNTFINEQLGNIESVLETPLTPEAVNGLIELTENTFSNHVASGHHFVKFYAPWCGHCQKLAPVWEELASSLQNDKSVSISKIDCTQHRSICSQFDIKGYPSLLWIQDGKKVDKYSGPRTHEELKVYVSTMLEKSIDEAKDETKTSDDDNTYVVLSLTDESFEHSTGKGVSFVKFFAPWCGHCKRLANTWDELGKKFIEKKNVRIAKVDCTVESNKKLCNTQEVEGFPTLFLYRDGRKISEYNGSRNLDDLYEFVTNHLQAHDEL